MSQDTQDPQADVTAMLLAAEFAMDEHQAEIDREAEKARQEASARAALAHDMLMEVELAIPTQAEIDAEWLQRDIRLAHHFMTYVEMTPDNAVKYFDRSRGPDYAANVVSAAQAQMAHKLK